ncbi:MULTISPECIES: glucose-6-phosphate isomerase [Myroides]|uniref:Glucose-6-phosphate isomerase n=1 Tax=Myroides albus TaxID=2562892 RepID=A0A6I3LFI3_9FLAO|nr:MULTISPECIES: glucose-6-phosphate isomerase [Myroides]MTG96667.1 glucose-6-phosphate isomerase [Myroides albus]MVX34750.1 glucose-6-phosphate isomerase [Myroides sp. LoEW2-1]UVD80921.1 glucose-6-phosphate isomerase [Myroides albus]
MLKSVNPSRTDAWKKLSEHFKSMEFVQMQHLFAENADRVNDFHVKWNSLLLDYSKNKVTAETMKLLLDLANEVDLKQSIEALFTGDKINVTEDRAVLHTVSRDFSQQPIFVDGEDVSKEVYKTREKIKLFSNDVISGRYLGATGKAITDVINIGIGGSDLGPKMVVEALDNYSNQLNVHFVSNIDDDYLFPLLAKLNAETTLVLVVSKTFTTQETIENAKHVKAWLDSNIIGSVEQHFVAVTSANQEAIAFGIKETNIFPMWDFIGGRFSLWSSVGISISLALGYDNYERLLKGAYQMDTHFRQSDFDQNIPVILALLSVWYNNFYQYETEAIVPYSSLLRSLPAHLQQMIMESNGKDKTREGQPVNYQTGTLIWGEVGATAQHAFFQLFHQGTKVVPIDFIGFIKPFHDKDKTNHDILMSNFFGQTEALLKGKRGRKRQEGELEMLRNFRDFEGNKPTNTFLFEQLTPETLGQIIAMYEHKTFVQGIIWNIFSFDQFGVEYGKVLAKNIQEEIKSKKVSEHDCSTSFLINYYLSN